jgi:hypothetical protein
MIIPLSADLLCKSPVRQCMVETFCKSIKAELILRNRWETRRQAEGAIFQYIDGFYNPRDVIHRWGAEAPSHTCRHVLSGSAWPLNESLHK